MDWSNIQRSRDLSQGKFPSVLKLRLIPDQISLVLSNANSDTRILDIGANRRQLYDVLLKHHGDIYYKSYDVDRNYAHDFYDINDIKEKFNLITCLEVIEHISVKKTFELISDIYRLLENNGVLIISTPNVCHPNAFWRDCTHKTAFRYNELAGILYTKGFVDLDVYRVGKLNLKGKIRYVIFKPLLKMLNVDFANGIVIKANKLLNTESYE